MERLGLVSRGDEGPDGGLRNASTQQEYYAYIHEKLDEYRRRFPDELNILSDESIKQREALDAIVRMYRKLREGLLASLRVDDFAVTAYEEAAYYSLLARRFEQAITSLSQLVNVLYPQTLETKRRREFVSYYLLYQSCHLRRYADFFSIRTRLEKGQTIKAGVLDSSDPIEIGRQITLALIRNDYEAISTMMTEKASVEAEVLDSWEDFKTALDKIDAPVLLPCHKVLVQNTLQTWFRDTTFMICSKAYISLDSELLRGWLCIESKDAGDFFQAKGTSSTGVVGDRIEF